MITELIYGNPTWLWGTILVVIFVGVSCGGLLLFHQVLHVDLRKAHNDLAGFIFAVVGVIYAVLLAFIAIATWQSFTNASNIVENESDFAGAIYLDTQGLTQSKGQAIRDAVSRYVTVVIEQEWPEQRTGRTPDQGWKPLLELNRAIATLQPQSAGEAVIQAELLKAWNELYLTRSSRLSAVEGHIPGVLWWIIFFGAVLTTGYTFLFGFENFGMHLAMTATVAVSLALVIVLIIAVDWPFRGEISISPDPFVATQRSWAAMPVH
jgi:hypothetical protein